MLKINIATNHKIFNHSGPSEIHQCISYFFESYFHRHTNIISAVSHNSTNYLPAFAKLLTLEGAPLSISVKVKYSMGII